MTDIGDSEYVRRLENDVMRYEAEIERLRAMLKARAEPDKKSLPHRQSQAQANPSPPATTKSFVVME